MHHLFFFFQLPSQPEQMQRAQDLFLFNGGFWEKYIARLTFWGKAVGVTRTETPDGQPALALLLSEWNNEDMLYSLAKDIATELHAPAYSLLIAPVDEETLLEITREQPVPWLEEHQLPLSN